MFYEVIEYYSETPPLPCFSSFVNDENSIIFLTRFSHSGILGFMTLPPTENENILVFEK